MIRKLTFREQVLLGLLGIVVMWCLFLRLLILPVFEEVSQAEQALENAKSRRAELELYTERLEALREEEENTEFFYHDMKCAQIDRMLQETASKAGIEILRMEIGKPEIWYEPEESLDDADGPSGPSIMEVTVAMEIQCPGTGSIGMFSEEIERTSRSLYLSHLNIEEAEGSLKGVVEVAYYYVQTE
ncbi:type II secretion system protein GspM [Lacrimispora sp. 210928-DFI.3.58]|uniref:type II secretion system protein GspM n=1 Tax=Lacrimispora sp. 210928-DFI.3.58 TaxID=2883214 RepID=UPI001D095934|nr:type II secretion system protein GspM [Lacrimispora sp. 210928-DFI.3.58]MCB7320952.1 type II secretion system protein M [Lacrimispora sp. 210928-DFI.3.58]